MLSPKIFNVVLHRRTKWSEIKETCNTSVNLEGWANEEFASKQILDFLPLVLFCEVDLYFFPFFLRTMSLENDDLLLVELLLP
jgi:hypothetical protein